MKLRKIAAALLLVLWPPIASGEEPPAMRILCWNIHHGVGLDKKLDLERIAAVIRAQNPDAVALQEVDRNCQRSGGVDQAAALAALTGLKSAFGEAMPYDGGSYGQAILSKHPISSTRVIRLSSEGEPRIAFVAGIDHPTHPFFLTSVHLNHQSAERRLLESTTLTKEMNAMTGSIVVAGDFNDVPDSPTISSFKAPWERLKARGPGETHPAKDPRKTIDHFLQRGFTPGAEYIVLEETIASDHRPIFVLLETAAK